MDGIDFGSSAISYDAGVSALSPTTTADWLSTPTTADSLYNNWSANQVTSNYWSQPALTTPTISQPTSSFWSGFTLDNIAKSVGVLNQAANSAVGLYKAVDSAPVAQTAGVYNAAGKFLPVSQNAPVVSPSGQVLTPGVSSQVGSTLSGVWQQISPFLPFIIIGIVVLFAFKLVKKL